MLSDEAFLASIELQGFDWVRGCYNCGCSLKKGKWHLCSYHEGFIDGFEAASVESPTKEEPWR